ncbi:chromosome partitioning protein, ParB family [Monaibacterium marinum]|uniref:Chromosome partitioning protein, ParB family n=1 Tax=Pontivivens marinum TaxID=1690039 RepID=A0A2C9CUL5_9RHOB|nr:ParB/RepB/Spo0J family partition protein [Monaibacterium marinum]SOH94962.1 chromosome partitioning protein, ParB family [Monaibacterium marinum]
MSRKRRTFQIDLPDEPAAPQGAPRISDPTGPAGRRGPMATAVRETGSSRAARADTVDAIRAENDRLAHEFVALKKQGLIVARIPLDAVKTSKLIRDRHTKADADLRDLVASIREVGLSNPIQVEQIEDGSYELIQGFRRLAAFRELSQDDESYATIPAGIAPAGQGVDMLYRRMVDENLVRKDISFAEMATLARDYAIDPQVGAPGVDAAIKVLYASSNAQKRSYIRSFTILLEMLEHHLEYPEEIPRALGLSLRTRMSQMPEVQGAIVRALRDLPNRTVEQELSVLRRFAAGADEKPAPSGQDKDTMTPALKPRGKTTLRIERPEGTAKLVASHGRVELKLDKDFSDYEASRMEQAVLSFLRTLDSK